jgi:hypothetical protein
MQKIIDLKRFATVDSWAGRLLNLMVNWRSKILNLSLCSSNRVADEWAEKDNVLAGAGVLH